MTVTVNLPRNVEQAYLIAARAKGVSVDALVSDVLLSHVPVAEAGQQATASGPQLIEEHGVAVLRTGQRGSYWQREAGSQPEKPVPMPMCRGRRSPKTIRAPRNRVHVESTPACR